MFIQVGRFYPIKNQLFTAKIARELKNRGKKIRILCAGNNGNEYEQQVREAIRQYGVEEYMLLLGVRKDIDELARKSAAFLLPSLYEGNAAAGDDRGTGVRASLRATADTYSREVDFGIGHVQWLRLEQGVAQWTDAVETAVNMGRADKREVVAAIEKYGFDSRVFAQRLCELYERSMEGETI